jgi:hypothetical protein
LLKLISAILLTNLVFSYPSITYADNNYRFLVLADMHVDHNRENTVDGQDTGLSLWRTALTKADELEKQLNVNFILVLGDLPSHSLLLPSRLADLRLTLNGLDTHANTNHLPLYIVPGNNDSLEGNYHSFNNLNGQNLFSLDPDFQPMIDCKQAQTNQACMLDSSQTKLFGYYSAYPLGSDNSVELIVLNTVIFTRYDYVSNDSISQAAAINTELKWLEQTLEDAKAHHKSVILAMHIPPGFDAYSDKPMWTKKENVHERFMNLLNQYQAQIRLILSAHTHMDEIRRIYDNTNHCFLLDVASPSISPVHHNQPSEKLFEINGQGNLVNTITYDLIQNTAYSLSSQFSSCRAETNMTQCLCRLSDSEWLEKIKPYYYAKGPGQATDWSIVQHSLRIDTPELTSTQAR